MSDTRAAIAEHVREHPGIHFNELVRSLDLAPGQVQYHLRRLRSGGRVVGESLYGRTHYYEPGYDPWERRALALLRRETDRDVLAALLDDHDVSDAPGDGEIRAPGDGGDAPRADPARDGRAGTPPGAVADRVGIARSTLEHHLDHLTEADLVEKRYDDRGRVTLHLARPAATARLLDSVSPSLPERFVDRFVRLVDDLLGGAR